MAKRRSIVFGGFEYDTDKDVIEGAISVDEAIQRLLMRPNKVETV